MTDSRDMQEAGKGIKVWNSLHQKVEKLGGKSSALQRLTDPEGVWLLEGFAKQLLAVDKVWSRHYRVKTEHASLKEAISVCCFDKVHMAITPDNLNIASTVIVDTDIYLLHQPKMRMHGNILRQLDELGLQAATPCELIGLYECYSKLKKTHAIAALGSTFRGCCVLSFYEEEYQQFTLDVRPFDDWGDDWWFAGTPIRTSGA